MVLLVLSAAVEAAPSSCRAFVVAIDVGHSQAKPGALSARGRGEFFFNRSIARLLLDRLVEGGFEKAFIIDEKGSEIGLAARAKAAQNAHLLISIHHDSVQPRYLLPWRYQGRRYRYSDRFKGYSIFYSEKNPYPGESRSFANFLGQALLTDGFSPTWHHAEPIAGESRDLVDRDKGIYRFDDLAVLKKANMPAVLLECGVIVNRAEELLLSDPDYQKKLVRSISGAVEKFCRSRTGGL